MRSLATDIREGLKFGTKQVRFKIFDEKTGGTNCAMGMALLGTGMKHENGVPMKLWDKLKKDGSSVDTEFKNLWPHQWDLGIITTVMQKNDFCNAGTSTCDPRPGMPANKIADQIEQMEWDMLGIPTKAMREELEVKAEVRVAVKS